MVARNVSGVALGIALIVVCACTNEVKNTGPQSSAPIMAEATSNVPIFSICRPLPGLSIPTSQISAHFPSGCAGAERHIVTEVMEMLPPRLRQYVAWFHVPAGKLGYARLPDSGLVVLFDKSDDKQDQSDHLAGGHYVLFFDGKIQPDSNEIFDYNLDSYLTIVPDGFTHYYPGTTQ